MGQGGRRRFLTGGGVAAVAAGVISTAAEAADSNVQSDASSGRPPVRLPGCATYHPNDALANAILMVWKDPSFKKQLLTFPVNSRADWSKFSNSDREKMIASTREALAKVDVHINLPVVLTPDQFNHYKPENKDEVVFVLPNPSMVYDQQYSLDTARVAMAIHCLGM